MTMNADPTFTEDGRPTIRIERTYRQPIERLWRAVTTAEHLGRWFPSPVTLDLRVGGAMRFAAFDDDVEGAVGVIEEVTPPHRLRFLWGDDTITFELAAAGDDVTTLTLVHSFDDRAGAASFATGWEQCLVGLRQVLADEPPSTFDPGVERHEQLVQTFGLDRPAVMTEPDGRWTIRIERQLTCPAEVAWDLWFGRDQQTGAQRSAPEVGGVLTPYMAPDVVLGTMTEVDLHKVMAWDVSAAGGPGEHVRVEFSEGSGHGARLLLIVTGSDPAERDQAIEMWVRRAIGHLAAQGADWAKTHPTNA
jgi:uncharacterized protein YndB with AHSA1/START domain